MLTNERRFVNRKMASHPGSLAVVMPHGQPSLQMLCYAGTNTSALLSGVNATATNSSSNSRYSGSGNRLGGLTDGEELDLDADLELAYSGGQW